MSPLLIFVLVLVFIIGGLLVFRDTAGLNSPRDKKADKSEATSTTSSDSGANCHHGHKTDCDSGSDGAGDAGSDGGSGD